VAARPLLRSASIAFGLLAAVTTAGAGGCGYSPNIENGKLRCGPNNSCPEGYSCGELNACWKGATQPESGTVKCGAGGACPIGYTCGLSNTCWRPADRPDLLQGCWVFDAGSVQQIDCSDGSTDRVDLATVGDFVEIGPGVMAAPLLTDYYCPDLELVVHGTTTLLEPGQGCTLTDPDTNDRFVHSAERFEFTTADGAKATVQLSMPFTFDLTTGETGDCTLRTNGTLTKGTAVTCPPILPAQSP
jgi:hypothetical protein